MPEGEGCPLNFAPMASTTLQLMWGDLLAAYHMVESGFTLEHFARFHPAGNLGARLLKVKELMHTDFPRVTPTTGLVEALGVMTEGKLGMTTVMEGETLVGVISEGDIRRALQGAERMRSTPWSLTARNIMTPNPICTSPEALAAETAKIMAARKITFVIVKDGDTARGVVHVHDLFAAKVI
jgi:arabinose-5-phosphate isomerase